MIRNRDTWANPYRTNTRQNGIRRHDQHGSELQDGLDASRGIVHALILGLAAWGLVAIVVAMWKGWL